MTAQERLAAIKARAEAQSRAHARMLEIDEGIGGLGAREPQMFKDRLTWQDASVDEHADTVLALVAALEAVLAINSGNNRRIYGNDSEAGMAKALWLAHEAIAKVLEASDV